MRYRTPALLTRVALTVHLLAAALWQPAAIAASQEALSDAKVQAIRELIRITNAQINETAFSEALTQQMLSVLRSRNPELTGRAERIVAEEVSAVVAREMANETLHRKIYPIYARYFTLEELRALIAFNQTAAGRKANEVMPLLIQESRGATQAWGREIGPRITDQVVRRFAREGIEVNTRPPGSTEN
jgi:uncharacterized protein